MNLIFLSFCLLLVALVALLIFRGLGVKSIISIFGITAASVMIGVAAIAVLIEGANSVLVEGANSVLVEGANGMFGPNELVLDGGAVFGDVRLAMDPLSAWFMLIIGIVFTAGAFYGRDYLKHYTEHRRELGLHAVAYLVTFGAMMGLCILRNSLAFLVAWEIMALGSFVLIIFESWKRETIKAGINFFIQSHISVVLLTIGFLMMAAKTGSYDFEAIKTYSQTNNCTAAFVLLFLGFAVKAGFVPFHTWLPHAHPAAPAHISGVMSGVIIKIGIYGILRMLTIFKLDFESIGYFILVISAVSGLYGVMLAIVQHNLKKLLAYHSIENIGIIGIGIGVGCVGLGLNIDVMAALGFSGALLHTLNHALFKSSLFFGAGNIYHAAQTLDIECLGGLGKRLPMTAFLFLVSSVAICGLPPMNGFVSEFLIYLGLFDWLEIAQHTGFVGAAFAILSLVMIGGLAILCFTKAFGIVFLGTPRSELPPMKEFGGMRLAPMFAIAAIMLSIGMVPQVYTTVTDSVLGEFGIPAVTTGVSHTISHIGIASMALIGVIGVLYLVRYLATRRKVVTEGETWGCGYTAGTPKIQYTATSFVKTYKKLFSALLGPEDKIEKHLIDAPLSAYQRFMGHFSFLQNGKLQFYILYGIIFIVLTIVLTFILS